MIKCNIEVDYYTENNHGEDEFSHSYVEYVINFPVLPNVGNTIVINPDNLGFRKDFEVLEVQYKTTIRDMHNLTCCLPEAEIYLIVKEIE